MTASGTPADGREPPLLSYEECLPAVDAEFRRWMAEPNPYPRELWGDIQVENHGYVVVDHRVTPTHVLVSYDGAPDPVTGEANPLAGNIPIGVDRRTGGIVEDAIPLLVLHWPEMPLRHHVAMWVERAAMRGTTVAPAGARADVDPTGAFRALRKGWVTPLLIAKGTVDEMVAKGSANLGVGDRAERLRSEAGRAMARTTCLGLEAAGVRLLVDGFKLLTILEFIDREPEPSPPGD